MGAICQTKDTGGSACAATDERMKKHNQNRMSKTASILARNDITDDAPFERVSEETECSAA